MLFYLSYILLYIFSKCSNFISFIIIKSNYLANFGKIVEKSSIDDHDSKYLRLAMVCIYMLYRLDKLLIIE